MRVLRGECDRAAAPGRRRDGVCGRKLRAEPSPGARPIRCSRRRWTIGSHSAEAGPGNWSGPDEHVPGRIDGDGIGLIGARASIQGGGKREPIARRD